MLLADLSVINVLTLLKCSAYNQPKLYKRTQFWLIIAELFVNKNLE